MVALRREEWDELSPEEKREHLIAEEKNVFGYDFKRDKHGRPIEQGIGSASQPSMNHFRARVPLLRAAKLLRRRLKPHASPAASHPRRPRRRSGSLRIKSNAARRPDMASPAYQSLQASFGGSAGLAQEVADMTDEQRRKKLLEMQQARLLPSSAAGAALGQLNSGYSAALGVS
jgi:hypothetical protein